MVLTMQAISLLYQFWVHTELVRTMGPLEWMMNTPSHHRVHHGSNRQYLDRNHAGVLIIWDRMFGTFEPEGEKVVYGLTKNINSNKPAADCVPCVDRYQATNWRQRLISVFGSPARNAAAKSAAGTNA